MPSLTTSTDQIRDRDRLLISDENGNFSTNGGVLAVEEAQVDGHSVNLGQLNQRLSSTEQTLSQQITTEIGQIELPGDPPFVLDFESSAAGWDGELFPANQTIESVNNELVITKTATGTGAAADARNLAAAGFTFVQGEEYEITFEVSEIIGDWAFRNQFSQSNFEQILALGSNTVTFTMDGSNGQFPLITRPSTVATQTEGDLIRIGPMSIRSTSDAVGIRGIIDQQVLASLSSVGKAEVGLGNVENLAPADLGISIATQSALDSLQAMIDGLQPEASSFTFDFTTGVQGWDQSQFAGVQTITTDNDQLLVTRTSVTSTASVNWEGIINQNLGFDLTPGETYTLEIDVDSLQNTWVLASTFSEAVEIVELEEGINRLTFVYGLNNQGQATATSAGNLLYPSIAHPSSESPVIGDFIRINGISVLVGDGTSVNGDGSSGGFDPNLEFTHIGRDIQFTATVSDESDRGVIIGNNFIGNVARPTTIGNFIDATHRVAPWSTSENVFGGARNPEYVAVGSRISTGVWRTTSIGDRSAALGQSSTALGYGAITLASHGVALGRGSYVCDESQLPFVGASLEPLAVYLGNGWHHRANFNMSGIAHSQTNVSPSNVVPSTRVSEFRGFDAFDARYPAWDATTDYSAPINRQTSRYIQHNGKAYKQLTGSGPSSTVVEPGVTAGWEDVWFFTHDVPQTGTGSGVPSDFNVDGGHARLIAGLSTGSGVGGTSGLSIGDGNDIGENRKQRITEAFYVDSDPGNANTYACLRMTDGTEHRVNIEADGTLKVVPRTNIDLDYRSN